MEENKIGEKFLPIGTVVMLKTAKKELMITSYCIFPGGEMYEKGKKTQAKEGQMFDYGACMFPEGIIQSDLIYGFNHDQIDKVLHMGYETENQKKLSELLAGSIELYKQKKIEEAKGNTVSVVPKKEDTKEEGQE